MHVPLPARKREKTTFSRPGCALLLLLAFVVCAASSVLGERRPARTTVSPIAKKPVREWSVSDVEYWMNHTVGYAEYTTFLRKYVVDGLTLLQMEAADFEEFLPLVNAIQVVKLKAHLNVLKGLCTCGDEDKVMDLWRYFKQENFRVWVVGMTSLFFPRVGMLYTFLFDDELYRLLVGVSAPQSEALDAAARGVADETLRTVPFLHTLAYLFSLVAAPHLFMAFEACRLFTLNYFIAPLIVVRCLYQALYEYNFLYLLYLGKAFPPGTPLLQYFFLLCGNKLFFPPAFLLLYPIMPYFLQCVCAVGVILFIFAHTIAETCLQFTGDSEKKD